MKNKGLGTGLGALFGDAALNEVSNDFEYLPLQRIEPRPDQPRSLFEQEKIDELTESIREHGILSPLTVRSVGDGYFQIVAGERRWRAARAAGITEVPVRVVVADDKKAMEFALVENLQREDLSPIEEARGYKSLMDDFEMTQEEISVKVSKSRPAVANALRLLTLPAGIIELVAGGELPAGSARALLALKSTNKMLTAAQMAVKNSLSVRDVEALVKKINREKAAAAQSEIGGTAGTEVDYILVAQKRLTDALGRRVIVRHGGKRGKIEIQYDDEDDFNALFDRLISR